ncbi:transcription initiation factor TFIIF subunit alpha [Cryptococcus deuterogattii 99/473]|uniref:Transcription initiation factor IIF subunit alpha n=1 Tax=Cryptococcus deuterogattii Ram5 TaxID=1296110 RepID=A0A0D0V9V3_9TREE|nr:transcription initiation factor TFIIF subunit alpha [Cryptococcus deuterogattii Ram5]KIY56958.1 transcription initiation factor TFIIF subunit alpha [Cryptococcus deuterogattii 99/473]
MSDATLFLRKSKDKQRRKNGSGASRIASTSNSSLASRPSALKSQPLAGPSSSGPPSSAAPSPSYVSAKSEPDGSNNPNITEIKIFSTGSNSALRYNLMRLNSVKDVDPTQITAPILMNRKKPGPKEPPTFALDENGKIVGRYVYDAEGRPVLDEDGQPVVERKEMVDMSLVGQAPGGGTKRRVKRGTKEVFHQDIEIMRLRREEALPWVLESGNPQDKPAQPEQWVGRMLEQGQLSTVLLSNDGTRDGFELMPLGRSYKFEPARPFKPLDSDAANKLFELQAKNKIHDRWAFRPADNQSGEASSASTPIQVKAEPNELEQRASRMETRIKMLKGVIVDRKVKVERYEDDYKREGHRVERGMEGGVDEELDFDEAEEFQDDDDNNTFYRDVREEEEARELEERLKKEFRVANANVGDRPQIDAEDDEDDLFGDKSLDDEGKKLRKIMRRRMRENGEDYDIDDESDSDSDDESVTSTQSKEKEKEKDKEKERAKERDSSRNPSQPPSRPTSRPPTARTSSPSGSNPRHPSPKKGKASTAPPPVSGASLIAQRATSRGASPRPSAHGGHVTGRASSPLGRAPSPFEGRGVGVPSQSQPASRATSPAVRGNSPPSGGGAATGGASPASGGPSTREVSPAPPAGRQSPKKENAASSSFAKRKSSPSVSTPSADAPPRPKKQKKTGSLTPAPAPEDIIPFPGMITKQDVLGWFQRNKKKAVPMNEAIGAFRKRIVDAGPNRDANQKLFLGWIRMVADQENGNLSLKPEFRQ